MDNRILAALLVAVSLKLRPSPVGRNYVVATKANVAKIATLAKASKYAGFHLHIELYGRFEQRPYLSLWLDHNSADVCDTPYTLHGFEQDLDSLS